MRKSKETCQPADCIREETLETPRDYSDEHFADLCKALGHPARLQILKLLIAKDSCVCGDIVEELPLAQATVSQHLKVLKETKLIQGEIEGRNICYCINPRTLKRLKTLIANL